MTALKVYILWMIVGPGRPQADKATTAGVTAGRSMVGGVASADMGSQGETNALERQADTP